MKYLLLAALFCPPAFAAPSCWTLDGSEIGLNRDGVKIADGQFLVTMDVGKSTKEDLLLVMQKVNYGNIKPSAYPTILDDVIVFYVETVKEGAERNALMDAVNAQIDEILAIPGVKGADCNMITGN